MKRVPSLMSNNVAVNKIITIPPEPVTVLTNSGKEITVLPPSVHIGLQPLNIRLISVNKRAGMVSTITLVFTSSLEPVWWKNLCHSLFDYTYSNRTLIFQGSEGSSSLPPADGVLFHCHGGGFVAQSSKSHETYLRDWAAKLNVPIVSIDYSLAPQAPFPRALDEVFYAYCWMLNNFKEIGSTGEISFNFRCILTRSLNLNLALLV